ncbi:MAG: tetratricopeptide repeat protein [Verrucomicrobia bacterium]|nr:tetratricopeptide repeat protein [Verrucomicrobiota bacterium]
MKTLEPPDSHHLNAAVGWIELGNALEAFDELELISPDSWFHPDVLVVRWVIYAKARKWDIALQIAQAVVSIAPERPMGWISLAYSLHELNRTQDAWQELLSVAERFPQNGAIQFNLACYACKLGKMDEAKTWLARSIEVAGREKIVRRVVNRPDLQPLWNQLGPTSSAAPNAAGRVSFSVPS